MFKKRNYRQIIIQLLLEEPKVSKRFKNWQIFIEENKEEIEKELKDRLIYLTTLRKSWKEKPNIKICEEEEKYKNYLKRTPLVGHLIGYERISLSTVKFGKDKPKMNGIGITLRIKIYTEYEEQQVLKDIEVEEVAEETAKSFGYLLRMINLKINIEIIERKKMKKKILFELCTKLSEGKLQKQFEKDYQKEKKENKTMYLIINKKTDQILRAISITYYDENK